MPHIAQQSYGKSRVRVTKIDRDGDVHHVSELAVDVELEGDFAAAYASGDNRLVIPTDTMKNTVYALARTLDVRELETFAWQLASHFVTKYGHVTRSNVNISRRPWKRVRSGGQPHPHVFIGCNSERETCTASATRAAEGHEPVGAVSCGLSDLALMTTAESGFRDFHRDEYTTLADTDDRVLATTVGATWSYLQPPPDLTAARKNVREALISTFGASYSPSVQATLFEMGAAVLAAVPEVESISLSMPNQHRLLVNLEAFGLDNPNTIFMATDEPYGDIRADVCRDDASRPA